MTPQMSIAITGKNMTKPAFDQVVTDANRAAAAVNDNGSTMATAMGGASFQTANLAAQFNDIGVMLASGQSPLLLAIQQGTQISQVLGPMGAAQAVNALKTAFISLFNPVSLITIGTIAAGAALFQYFTSLNTDGKASTEVIKEQNDLLQSVAENWGDAVPALKAYLDQLDRAADLSDLNVATDVAVQRQFEVLQSQLGDWRAELAAARIDIQAFGGDAQEIDALQTAFETLDAKMRAGTATTADLDAVLQTLAGTTGSKSVPSLMGFAGILEQVRGLLASVSANAAQLRAERDALLMQGPDPKVFYDQQDFIAEQERVNGLTATQLRLEQEVARVKSEAKTGDVVITEQQALSLAQQRLDAEQRRSQIASADKSSSKAVSDIERERKAVADLIAELEHEQSLVGMSNTDKAVQNALRQAGAAATEEQRQRIVELITATEEQNAAEKRMTEQWNQYGQIGQTAVRGVASALRDGKLEADELSSIIDKILDSMIDMALNNAFDMMGSSFGGGGGNWLSSLLGMGGGSTQLRLGYNLPGYASGTDNFPGGWATINENGGEIVNLPSGSQVIPHDLSKDIVQQAGQRRVEVHVHQDPSHQGAPEASVTNGGDVDVVRVIVGTVGQAFAEGRLDGAMKSNFGVSRKAVA